MREATIAENYAQALFALAQQAGDLHGWETLVGGLADAMGRDRTLRLFLESPRIAAGDKAKVLARAFEKAPRRFVLFLQAVVHNRRQMLFPEISAAYMDLVDEVEGRIHAMVTVARETSDADRDAIARQLSKVFGKQVVAHLSVHPAILGGAVVRVGDYVMDGSVRKRLTLLRAGLVTA
ncbi:MAG: F0F1 ATP synthase subunit delta [Gemmatimonadota bacterium]|nr:F0F1 ATP synthase subunit delta [Gemmatimonadota bacterium]MDE3129038.1 F0F1 ATP synthase subunit delta [Gemmatimonadota bacterium]MDE3172824.1 F0F1 ATP synthase subunit delta [Gemmatimonadota bacterium]MDE3215870.1 F0F1 ATP synthase subunit delta [Gemmatimonadota bacterium]